jgi:hypothetical protein
MVKLGLGWTRGWIGGWVKVKVFSGLLTAIKDCFQPKLRRKTRTRLISY